MKYLRTAEAGIGATCSSGDGRDSLFIRLKILVAALTVLLAASHTAASTISYTGSLDPDDPNSFALFQVTLASTSDLDIQTWSYGGGTNAAGQVIPAGGFAPYVSLFAGFGDGATFLASSDTGVCPPQNGTVACEDVSLEMASLAAGNYTVALSVFENMSFAENLGTGTLGDGFIGLGNYYDPASDSVLSPNYAIDISSDSNLVQTPEPPTFGLVSSVVLLVLFLRRGKLPISLPSNPSE
jgi:hypothetical protein